MKSWAGLDPKRLESIAGSGPNLSSHSIVYHRVIWHGIPTRRRPQPAKGQQPLAAHFPSLDLTARRTAVPKEQRTSLLFPRLPAASWSWVPARTWPPRYATIAPCRHCLRDERAAPFYCSPLHMLTSASPPAPSSTTDEEDPSGV